MGSADPFRDEPGRANYEADVAARPLYRDGTPRKAWHELGAEARWLWWGALVSPRPRGADPSPATTDGAQDA